MNKAYFLTFAALLLPALVSCAEPTSSAPQIGVISVQRQENGYRCTWAEDVKVSPVYVYSTSFPCDIKRPEPVDVLKTDCKLRLHLDSENDPLWSMLPLEALRLSVSMEIEECDDPEAYAKAHALDNDSVYYSYVGNMPFREGLAYHNIVASADILERYSPQIEEIELGRREYSVDGRLLAIDGKDIASAVCYQPLNGSVSLAEVGQSSPLFRVTSSYDGEIMYFASDPRAIEYRYQSHLCAD